MNGALLSAALAVLVWPDRGVTRRHRVSLVAGAEGRAGWRSGARPPLAVVAAVGAATVAAVVSTALVSALAAAAAYASTRAWSAGRERRVQGSRLGSLADGLGALAAELRSGRSLESAVAAARTACGDDPTGRALVQAVRAPGAGSSLEGHAPLTEALRRVSAAVVLSGRTGCSLAAVVGAVEDDLRARNGASTELRSATAGARASAMVLAGLPVLGLAMGSGVGADPWRVLTTTGSGQVLLVVGTGLECAGLAWSRRLIDRALGP